MLNSSLKMKCKICKLLSFTAVYFSVIMIKHSDLLYMDATVTTLKCN